MKEARALASSLIEVRTTLRLLSDTLTGDSIEEIAARLHGALERCLRGAAIGELTKEHIRSPSTIVRRTEEFYREHLGERVSISELSMVAGVSERSLRNAFHQVCMTSPKKYLRLLALHQVRRSLRAAPDAHAAVTTAATRHGFYELGASPLSIEPCSEKRHPRHYTAPAAGRLSRVRCLSPWPAGAPPSLVRELGESQSQFLQLANSPTSPCAKDSGVRTLTRLAADEPRRLHHDGRAAPPALQPVKSNQRRSSNSEEAGTRPSTGKTSSHREHPRRRVHVDLRGREPRRQEGARAHGGF